MSSSSSAVFDLDLGPVGMARLDPARIEEAVAEGHAAGFAAGKAEADRAHARLAADYEARLAAVVHRSEAAVAELLASVQEMADASARATASAAFEIAEAIVGRELALAAEPGADAVARALALAPERAELELHLHPTDAAALAPDQLSPHRTVTVVPDPAVAIGDCVADTGWTRIDAQVAPALERVRAVLEGPR